MPKNNMHKEPLMKKSHKKAIKYSLLLLPVSLLCIAGIYICTYAGTFQPFHKKEPVEAIAQKPIDSVQNAFPSSDNPDNAAPKDAERDASVRQTPAAVFEEYDIRLMMVGDNLCHMGIVKTGLQTDGSYDYSMLFTGIRNYLEAADIKIINQETILGGNALGFSGFPYFNSPTEIGDAIADSGFNVVLHASNHAADKNYAGLKSCASFWEKYPEIMMLGIQGDDSDSVSASDPSGQRSDSFRVSDRIGYFTVKDCTFALLNYTYGPNTETLPSSIKGHLNMLCAYHAKSGAIDFTSLNPQVLEDIALAKENADFVIVCPHWGTEYVTEPSKYQKKFAMEMAEAGADIIIGTHPHVVQPVEWLETESGHRTLCYYSLGNYLSTQKKPINLLEGMAWIQFHVTEEGIFLDEKQTGIVPLVCQYTSGPVRFENVYPLKDYTEEQARSHGIRQYGGVPLLLSDLHTWAEEIMGDFLLYPEF